MQMGITMGIRIVRNHNSVSLGINQAVFVDLGLASGTLWSTDYEKNKRCFYYPIFGLWKKV